MTPAAYVEAARVERARIALGLRRPAGGDDRPPDRLRHGRDDAPGVQTAGRRQPGRLPQPLPLGGGVTPEGAQAMRIAIPLYDRFTALDAVGPYEVLQRLPGRRDHLARHEPGPVGTDTGQLAPGRRRRLRGPARSGDPGRAGRHRHRTPCSTTSASSAGSGAPTRPRSGPPRSAPARCCSAPPACSTGSRRPATGSTSTTLERYGARPTEPARRRAGQGDHRGRRVVGDRHGPDVWRRRSPGPRWPRRSSWRSSTTRSRRSTPARSTRRRPRSSS